MTAAPAVMWRQVARHLLPTATVASGSLSLPRNDETWRLQALAEDLTSTWRDVAPEEGSVELALQQVVDLTVQTTADGAPLAGARLYLLRAGSGMAAVRPEPLGFGISDTDGKVSLTVSERERAAVLVSHVTRTAAAFERFAEAPPVVELGPGLAVTGRTVDLEGQSCSWSAAAGSVVGGARSFQCCSATWGSPAPTAGSCSPVSRRAPRSLRTDGSELEYSESVRSGGFPGPWGDRAGGGRDLLDPGRRCESRNGDTRRAAHSSEAGEQIHDGP